MEFAKSARDAFYSVWHCWCVPLSIVMCCCSPPNHLCLAQIEPFMAVTSSQSMRQALPPRTALE
eukprot:4202650-Lingulodinium_polyedra.AAC.1